MFRGSRVTASFVISLTLLAAPMLAPEHVHEADAHHGDSIAHRHVASHEHDGASFDDEDGHITWLDVVAIAPGASHVLAPPAILVEPFELLSADASSKLTDRYTPRAAHGPPRALVPARAPPASV